MINNGMSCKIVNSISLNATEVAMPCLFKENYLKKIFFVLVNLKLLEHNSSWIFLSSDVSGQARTMRVTAISQSRCAFVYLNFWTVYCECNLIGSNYMFGDTLTNDEVMNVKCCLDGLNWFYFTLKSCSLELMSIIWSYKTYLSRLLATMVL